MEQEDIDKFGRMIAAAAREASPPSEIAALTDKPMLRAHVGLPPASPAAPTDEQIAGGVDFIMGPRGDEGTRMGQHPDGPYASPAATPITLCNGKPCDVAAELMRECAALRTEAEALKGRLAEAEKWRGVMTDCADRAQQAAESAESALAAAKASEGEGS